MAPEGDRPDTPATDVFELRPIPAQELDNNTFDGPSMYYLAPHPATAQAWLAIKTIVAKNKTALVAKGALRRGSEKLWRIDSFRNYLVLREIVFPEDIRDIPAPVETTLEKGTVGLVDEFLKNLVTTWDSIDTVDRSREQLEAWINQGDTVAIETEQIDRTDAAASLIDQLTQATKK